MRAVVVGGGIGGLAAAIALRRAGVEVIVVEQGSTLRQGGFGLVLAANAVRALRELGLLGAVRACATRVARAEVRNPRDVLLACVPYAELGWETYGILRSALLELLAAAVPADCVRLNACCEAVEGARVVLADGSTIEADLIVGADGLHSSVRRSLHGDEPLRYGGHRAWRTSVAFDHPRIRDTFTEVWGVGGGFGFGPAGGGNVYWYCFHAEPENAPEPSDLRATLLERYGQWFEPIPALVAATPAEALHSTLTYDRRPLRAWGRGRVTLLGDAAHPMKPNIGQGAAQALEDAVVLGYALRGAADPGAALRHYERQRVRRANAIVRASRQAGVAAEVRSRVGTRVRDTIFRALPNAVTIAQQRRVLEFEP